MALQGSIETFALPDVLRLLDSTRKTGRLQLSGDRGEGHIWVSEGSLVGVEAPGDRRGGNPEAAVNAIFELLRFRSGDFVFDHDLGASDPDQPLEIGEIVGRAEEMLEELRALEQVVPSEHVWITLHPGHSRRAEDEIQLNGPEWQVICAVRGGATVADLRLELARGELDALRAVRDLVERGLLSIDEDHRPEPTEATSATPALEALAEQESDAAGPAGRAAEPLAQEEPVAEIVRDDPAPAEPEPVAAPEPAAEPEPAPLAEETSNGAFSFSAVAEPAPEPEPAEPSIAGLGEPPADSEPSGRSPVEDRPVRDSFEVFVGDAHGAALDPEPAAIRRDGDVEPAAPMLDDLPPVPKPEPETTGGRHDAADMARQLANLSPAAAKAVAAAARAESAEAREEALAGIPQDEAEMNRDLLLKFLSSVKS